MQFLQQHEKDSPDKPFFLYLAYTAAHWPMHALEKDIAKYKGRFDAGYYQLRQERMARLQKLGLADQEWKNSPTAGTWPPTENKAWELRCMEVYAAMIDNMDQGIGRVLAQLKSSGRLENTVVLFLQDNGGCAEDNGRKTPKSVKKGKLPPMQADEIQKQPKPAHTRDGRPVRQGPDAMPGPADTFVAYGRSWANVSNTPFREYKHWVHEGGISTPLIVHWPAGIPAKARGTINLQDAGHVIDFMPTFVELAGAEYPRQFRGKAIKPMEGVSLLPALTGKPFKRSEPLFWEHESNRAVRSGDWKIVAKENEPWELYNLRQDRTEMHNLADQNSDLVKELAGKWDAWAARANVLPLGTWKASRP